HAHPRAVDEVRADRGVPGGGRDAGVPRGAGGGPRRRAADEATNGAQVLLQATQVGGQWKESADSVRLSRRRFAKRSPTSKQTRGSSAASCPRSTTSPASSRAPRTNRERRSSGRASWRSSDETSTSSSRSASPACASS